MSTLPPDRIRTSIDWNKIFLDETNRMYGLKTIETLKFDIWSREHKVDKSLTKVEKAYPENNGFSKAQTQEVFIVKQIASETSLENTEIYFKMLLKFEVPSEKRYKFYYLSKVRSGKVFLTNFESGSTSECGVNDAEFVIRTKAKKVPANTILSKNAPVFKLSSEGVLERRL